MKTSPSKFQRLLRLKRLEEYKAQKELARVLLKEKWFADRIDSLKEEISKTEEGLVALVDLSQHDQLRNFLTELELALPGMEQEKIRLQQERGERQEDVKKKCEGRKVVENIWQNRYTAWLRNRIRQQSE